MEAFKIRRCFRALIIGWLLFCDVGYAQDSDRIFARVYKAEGYYEYNKDGVPLLGFVTARLKGDLVKFTMCSNETIDVEFKDLKASPARCPSNDRDPGLWTAKSRMIVPVLKAAESGSPTLVRFQGKYFDMSEVPGGADYKDIISKAKVGDPVGFAFTAEDGKKSIGIITLPIQK